MTKFKELHSFEKRLAESQKILEKYRSSAPVIVEPYSDQAPSIDRCKFLVPWDLTYGQLIYVVRKRIDLSREKSLFMFCSGIVPMQNKTIIELHRMYGEEDGFLYFTYALEDTFG